MDLKTLNYTFALCEMLRASVNFSRGFAKTASLSEGQRNAFLEGASNEEIKVNLKLAENELNALEALDLFAVFERELRDAAQNAVTSHIPTPNPGYRNWIAHGKNPRKMPSVIMSPKDIFEILTEFINQAANIL